jgi:hypothetical protein
MSNLKKIRLGLGLSLREAQEVSGMSYECVRLIESRLASPRPETVVRLMSGYRDYALSRASHYANQARMIV